MSPQHRSISWKRPTSSAALALMILALIVLCAGAQGISPTSTNDPAAGAEPAQVAAQPEAVDEVDAVAAPAGMVARYKRIAGTAFHPRRSATGFESTYFGAADDGCLVTTSDPSGIFVADLQLPDDAVITTMRVYYYDSASANGILFITAFNDLGGFVGGSDLAYVQTQGNGGFGTNAVTLNFTVDTTSQSLVLQWRSNVSGTVVAPGVALCGVRLVYYVPFSQLYLPVTGR